MRIHEGILLPLLAVTACAVSQATSVEIPAPKVDAPLAAAGTMRSVVLAGGCFWGIEAVFDHVRGVTSSMSGYAGGKASTARYEMVVTGSTGHAESVQVTYDASQLTYGQILHVFFSVAHDPTQLNRQGPDVGTQYRSAIFFANADEKRIARAYIAQLDEARVYRQPIVTELVPLSAFYPAEDYHQDYAARHPSDLYIRINDAPKVAALRTQFPGLYVGK